MERNSGKCSDFGRILLLANSARTPEPRDDPFSGWSLSLQAISRPQEFAEMSDDAHAPTNRLRELLHWLVQVIEETYGTIAETQTERQLCSELLS